MPRTKDHVPSEIFAVPAQTSEVPTGCHMPPASVDADMVDADRTMALLVAGWPSVLRGPVQAVPVGTTCPPVLMCASGCNTIAAAADAIVVALMLVIVYVLSGSPFHNANWAAVVGNAATGATAVAVPATYKRVAG